MVLHQCNWQIVSNAILFNSSFVFNLPAVLYYSEENTFEKKIIIWTVSIFTNQCWRHNIFLLHISHGWKVQVWSTSQRAAAEGRSETCRNEGKRNQGNDFDAESAVKPNTNLTKWANLSKVVIESKWWPADCSILLLFAGRIVFFKFLYFLRLLLYRINFPPLQRAAVTLTSPIGPFSIVFSSLCICAL